MNWTHETPARKWFCLQVTANNSAECIALLEQCGAECEMFRGDTIMTRWKDRSESVRAINSGDWLAIGEDMKLRIYDPAKHAIKCKELESDK